MRKLENGNVVLETSTDIWPIAFCGTYDGQPCDFDRLFGDDTDDVWSWSSDGDHVVSSDDFDFGKWKEAIRKELNDLLGNEFPTSTNRFGVWIGPVKATEISSPREYNFTTDCAMLDVEVGPDFVGKAISRLSDARDDNVLRDRIDNWIEDHWKSCSGFSSWMPESWDDFISVASELDEYIAGDKDGLFNEAQAAGAVLTLLAVCSDAYAEDDYGLGVEGGIDFLTEELSENLMDNHSPSEFRTEWLFSDLVEKLEPLGIKPIDFGRERNRMDNEWKKLFPDGFPSWDDPRSKDHRVEEGRLEDDMSGQDALLIEWAKSSPGSQEEFNALGRLREFIDSWNAGRAA